MIIRFIGLGLILAGIATMYAAVIFSQGSVMFGVAIGLGVIGGFLAWLGKHRMDTRQRQAEEEHQADSSED
ncbi:hypothetical protein ABFB09_00310 [Dehalogenimonas sp. THU2]|uniref:hypothetical protein n=1 Tax=Dehalogenimonas sp. THU2 TaxID=3151121 RepID=UPI0032187A8B